MPPLKLFLLTKLVIFSIVIGIAGLTLLIIGLAVPPIARTASLDIAARQLHVSFQVHAANGQTVSYLVQFGTYPNPLQLPFLIAGSLLLITGLGLLTLRQFKPQSLKLPWQRGNASNAIGPL